MHTHACKLLPYALTWSGRAPHITEQGLSANALSRENVIGYFIKAVWEGLINYQSQGWMKYTAHLQGGQG